MNSGFEDPVIYRPDYFVPFEGAEKTHQGILAGVGHLYFSFYRQKVVEAVTVYIDAVVGVVSGESRVLRDLVARCWWSEENRGKDEKGWEYYWEIFGHFIHQK